MDPGQVYDSINLGRRIDVQWPAEDWRKNGGKNAWLGWAPVKGMEGSVVHKWMPCHADPGRRSHVDKTILLVQIGDKFVPVSETGIIDLGAEVWHEATQHIWYLRCSTSSRATHCVLTAHQAQNTDLWMYYWKQALWSLKQCRRMFDVSLWTFVHLFWQYGRFCGTILEAIHGYFHLRKR